MGGGGESEERAWVKENMEVWVKANDDKEMWVKVKVLTILQALPPSSSGQPPAARVGMCKCKGEKGVKERRSFLRERRHRRSGVVKEGRCWTGYQRRKCYLKH